MALAAAYLALLLAIQAGNFYAYLRHANSWSFGGFLLRMPLMQAQNITVCAALAGLVWLLTGIRGGRAISFLLLICIDVFSLVDQVYYKVSLDHLRLSLLEGHKFYSAQLRQSFAREHDYIFWIASAVALAGCSVSLWVAFRPSKSPARTSYTGPVAVAIAGALFIAGVPGLFASPYYNLNQNPVWGFALDWQRASLASTLGAGIPDSAPAPSSGALADRDPRMLDLQTLRHHPGTLDRPNVILIILESVGEENLFDSKGNISPVVTPVIAGLASKSLVFDRIYTPIPASTRSLISIETGGRDLSFGGDREFTTRFTGPSMPAEFHKLGYRTSFISGQRLDGEYSDVFLGLLGFDYLYDYETETMAVQVEHRIHSWGAQELYTMNIIKRWIGEHAPRGPFLLEYYTAATHYPYGSPKDFPTVAPPGTPHNDYLNALHYTDYAIGQLIGFLREKGLQDHTVIAITGDHGEAFGDPHPWNRLHRDYIYEENIRDFLLLYDPATKKHLVSHRLGSNGDIMPTLLSRADDVKLPPDTIPGRDLTAETVEQGVVYFYKSASPEKWGLRDGDWKYISDMRKDAPELYDLANDPAEKNNLASLHPDIVSRYRALCLRALQAKTVDYRRFLAR